MTILNCLVKDPERKPVRGASVQVFAERIAPFTLRTGVRGDFALDSDTVSKRCCLQITCLGFGSLNQDIVVPSAQSEEEPLEIILHRGSCSISGHITEEGEEEKPLKTEITLLHNGVVVQRTQSKEKSGNLLLDSLQVGQYELTVTSQCHFPRAWRGLVDAEKTVVNLKLQLIDGCIALGKCDVCGQDKLVKYCRFCHAYICDTCKRDYPERIKAMLRRMNFKSDASEDDLAEQYEKTLNDLTTPKRKRCSSCL